MRIEGEVFTGLGEGADYIGMKPYQDKTKIITGFYPFEGTLNLRVDAGELERLRKENEPEVIESFRFKGRECSRVEVYPVKIEGVDAAYLDIAVTDHGDDVMEIVAEQYLRDELGLQDGDAVEVTPK